MTEIFWRKVGKKGESDYFLKSDDGTYIKNKSVLSSLYTYNKTFIPSGIVKNNDSWDYYEIEWNSQYFEGFLGFVYLDVPELYLLNKNNTARWKISFPASKRGHSFRGSMFSGNSVYALYDKIGIYKLDASTGISMWNIRKKSNSSINQYIETKNYLWIFFEGAEYRMVSSIYRINLSTLEIMRLKTPKKNYKLSYSFFEYDDNLFLSSKNNLYLIDQETGVISKEYDLCDYFDYNVNSTPMFDGYYGDRGLHYLYYTYNNDEYFFNVFDSKLLLKLSTISKDTRKVYTRSSSFISNTKNILQNGVFLDEDETRMFAVDMKTGEEIWWIDKSKFEEPWRLLIIDSRGVLISQGYRLTCFRAIDEQ